MTKAQMDTGVTEGHVDRDCQIWREGQLEPVQAGHVYPQLEKTARPAAHSRPSPGSERFQQDVQHMLSNPLDYVVRGPKRESYKRNVGQSGAGKAIGVLCCLLVLAVGGAALIYAATHELKTGALGEDDVGIMVCMVVFLLGGSFTLLGALLEWSLLFESRQAKGMRDMFGDRGARRVYVVGGTVFLMVGCVMACRSAWRTLDAADQQPQQASGHKARTDARQPSPKKPRAANVADAASRQADQGLADEVHLYGGYGFRPPKSHHRFELNRSPSDENWWVQYEWQDDVAWLPTNSYVAVTIHGGPGFTRPQRPDITQRETVEARVQEAVARIDLNHEMECREYAIESLTGLSGIRADLTGRLFGDWYQGRLHIAYDFDRLIEILALCRSSSDGAPACHREALLSFNRASVTASVTPPPLDMVDWHRTAAYAQRSQTVRRAPTTGAKPATPGSSLSKALTSGRIRCVALSDKARFAAAGDLDGNIYLFDPQTQAVRAQFQAHSGAVGSIAISPDGTRLVSSAQNDATVLWDASGNTICRSQHRVFASDIRFSSDGVLATGASAHGLIVWDVSSGSYTTLPAGRTAQLSWPADGPLVAATDERSNVSVWDVSAKRMVFAKSFGREEFVLVVMLSLDGSRLYTCHEDRKLIQTEIPSGESSVLHVDFPWSRRMAICGNGGIVIVVSTMGVIVQDLATNEQVDRFEFDATCKACSFTRDARHGLWLGERKDKSATMESVDLSRYAN